MEPFKLDGNCHGDNVEFSTININLRLVGFFNNQ